MTTRSTDSCVYRRNFLAQYHGSHILLPFKTVTADLLGITSPVLNMLELPVAERPSTALMDRD